MCVNFHALITSNSAYTLNLYLQFTELGYYSHFQARGVHKRNVLVLSSSDMDRFWFSFNGFDSVWLEISYLQQSMNLGMEETVPCNRILSLCTISSCCYEKHKNNSRQILQAWLLPECTVMPWHGWHLSPNPSDLWGKTWPNRSIQ